VSALLIAHVADGVETDIYHVSGTAVAVEMLMRLSVLMLYVSGTAVAVEMLITAVLVLVVFAAAADSNNTVNAAVSADVVCFRDCCCC
jgi:hypothetical protein